MVQRLTPLAVLGHLIVDDSFANAFLSEPDPIIVSRNARSGLPVGPTDESEIQAMCDELRPRAADVHHDLRRIRSLLGCPRKPCPKGLANGSLKVLALLGNACVDPVFREAFFASPVSASLFYFRVSNLDATERDELQGFMTLDSESVVVIKGSLAAVRLILRCPRGCPILEPEYSSTGEGAAAQSPGDSRGRM